MKRAAVALVSVLALCIHATILEARTLHDKILYSFGGADGLSPQVASGKTLYGTTEEGGTVNQCSDYGCGTVYAVDRKSGAETVLHSFGNGTDGYYPNSGLIKVGAVLYGTTMNGGGECPARHQKNGCGTVFAIDPASGAETGLYHFCQEENCGDGAIPAPGLIRKNRKIYGSTTLGGSTACHNGCGTIFMLNPGTGEEKVIYSFLGGADGRGGAYLINVNGMFYGTTPEGGGSGCDGYGCGTLFELDPATGKETVLYSFTGGTDGSNPVAAPIEVNGMLYGETSGTLFAFNLTTGKETTIYDFPATAGHPDAPMIELSGTLYGTLVYGGLHNQGAVFALDPATGAVTTVYSFAQTRKRDDGINPDGLIAVNDILYGVTVLGGAGGGGTIFSLKP